MVHRLATEKDIDEVYDLYMAEPSNMYLTYDPMDITAFASIYPGLLDTETLYVVEKENELIATYRIIPKTDRQAHTVYLGGFTIKQGLQGQGFGSQILSHIKKAVAESGKIRIELTVDIDNASAIGLYKKMGFIIEGHIKKSYKRSSTNSYYDEYLMGLIL
jgi:RimJ/RimL family protein N-acetyltransferase